MAADAETPVTPAQKNLQARRQKVRDNADALTAWQARSFESYWWTQRYGHRTRPREYQHPLEGSLDDFTRNLRGDGR